MIAKYAIHISSSYSSRKYLDLFNLQIFCFQLLAFFPFLQFGILTDALLHGMIDKETEQIRVFEEHCVPVCSEILEQALFCWQFAHSYVILEMFYYVPDHSSKKYFIIRQSRTFLYQLQTMYYISYKLQLTFVPSHISYGLAFVCWDPD